MPPFGQYPPPRRRSFGLPVLLGLLVAIALIAGVVMVVTDPNGIEIYYSNDAPTDSEGWLDRDANVGCPQDAEPPLENVFWPVGEAPSGDYTVEVHGFSVGDGICGDGAYTLTISIVGQEDQVYTGTVDDGVTDSYTATVD